MSARHANRRLVRSLLGLLLLALWGFVGYWSWSQHQKTMVSAAQILEQLTSAAEEQATRLFKQAETSLAVTRHWMASHAEEDPPADADFITLADKLRALSEGTMDIRLVTRQGGLFYIPKKTAKPLADVSDRDYFKVQADPARRGLYIADPVISRVTGKWGIPVSVPVDKAGGDIGVVFVAMELDRLAKTFEAERPKPDGAISLIRTDGTFLFRVPQADLVGKNIGATRTWADYYAKSPRGTYISDGSIVGTQSKLVSYARLRDYPVFVTVTSEISDLLEPWRRETLALLSVATAVTVLTLGMAFFLLQAMKAEDAALRESERAHRDARLILTSAGEGICGVDAQGRIGFINPAAQRMLGLGDSSPVGYHLAQIGAVGPYQHGQHQNGPIQETLADGAPREARHQMLRRADGSRFPVDMVVTAVREDNTVTGAVVVFHDISDRLAAESALEQQASELSRSNADLEQFAYIASHDLREPLRQVASFVSLLERRYADKLDQDGRDYIAYARDGAARMSQLIIDLLDFSRVGRNAPPPRPLSLEGVMDEVEANLSVRIGETSAQFLRDESLPSVMGLHDDLVRVFQNLCANALKYRHAERSPVIRITAVKDDTEAVITVADNGIGIDPQYFDKIFGIFQRLHTRDSYEGTGIGLAICRKSIDYLGGRIWVDSVPGEGSRFHVALPLARA